MERFSLVKLWLPIRSLDIEKYSGLTREVLGHEELTLPATQLRTTGYWLSLSPEKPLKSFKIRGFGTTPPIITGRIGHINGFWRASVINIAASIVESRNREKLIMFIIKSPSGIFSPMKMPTCWTTLVTLCPGCHKIAETAVRMKSGLSGARHVLSYIAPLFVMCDINDLGALSDPASPLTGGKPTILLYDQIPAGIGLSKSLFDMHNELMLDAYDLVRTCTCKDGCPGLRPVRLARMG